ESQALMRPAVAGHPRVFAGAGSSFAGGRRDCRGEKLVAKRLQDDVLFLVPRSPHRPFSNLAADELPVRSVPAKSRSHSPTNGPARPHITITTRPFTVPALRSSNIWLMSSSLALWISARTLPSA